MRIHGAEHGKSASDPTEGSVEHRFLHADAALPSDDDLISQTGVNLIYSPLATGQRQVLGAGTCRSNSASQVSLYLVAQIGLSNVNVKGYISARRVR